MQEGMANLPQIGAQAPDAMLWIWALPASCDDLQPPCNQAPPAMPPLPQQWEQQLVAPAWHGLPAALAECSSLAACAQQEETASAECQPSSAACCDMKGEDLDWLCEIIEMGGSGSGSDGGNDSGDDGGNDSDALSSRLPDQTLAQDPQPSTQMPLPVQLLAFEQPGLPMLQPQQQQQQRQWRQQQQQWRQQPQQQQQQQLHRQQVLLEAQEEHCQWQCWLQYQQQLQRQYEEKAARLWELDAPCSTAPAPNHTSVPGPPLTPLIPQMAEPVRAACSLQTCPELPSPLAGPGPAAAPVAPAPPDVAAAAMFAASCSSEACTPQAATPAAALSLWTAHMAGTHATAGGLSLASDASMPLPEPLPLPLPAPQSPPSTPGAAFTSHHNVASICLPEPFSASAPSSPLPSPALAASQTGLASAPPSLQFPRAAAPSPQCEPAAAASPQFQPATAASKQHLRAAAARQQQQQQPALGAVGDEEGGVRRRGHKYTDAELASIKKKDPARYKRILSTRKCVAAFKQRRRKAQQQVRQKSAAQGGSGYNHFHTSPAAALSALPVAPMPPAWCFMGMHPTP